MADPDTNSKVGDKDLWRSYLLKGRVSVVTTGSGGYSVSVTWDNDLVSESENICTSTFCKFSVCKGPRGQVCVCRSISRVTLMHSGQKGSHKLS